MANSPFSSSRSYHHYISGKSLLLRITLLQHRYPWCQRRRTQATPSTPRQISQSRLFLPPATQRVISPTVRSNERMENNSVSVDFSGHLDMFHFHCCRLRASIILRSKHPSGPRQHAKQDPSSLFRIPHADCTSYMYESNDAHFLPR